MSEREIFIAALQIDEPAKRNAFLDESCHDDAPLRRRVDVLLETYRKAGSFLENAAEPGTIAHAATDEGAGSRIGPYKLLQRIAEGGMGVVWLAEQEEPLRRQVALKVIKPGMDSAAVLARFEAERQALALMDHPNIAKVLDAGSTPGGRPYFVMELVKGVPITRYCDEQKLTPRERLELIVPVCHAVQHAHQKGIIHRDLKPSNVLVASYDSRPVPKVIDFGVAKATGQQLTARTLFTGFGGIVGTLEYMSPEQAEFNALDVDTRSDIYSLGVLLYELLTGTTPVTQEDLKQAAFAEALRLIREQEPPRPSTRLSKSTESLASISAQRKTEPARLPGLLRGEVDWIVMKTLEKDRRRRYETASALARDIEHYLADEPVEACPPTTGYRLRKFARKHRGGLVTTAAFLLLLVVGVVASAWQAVRATNAERLALVERDRALAAEEKTKTEAETARAVIDFIDADLMGLVGTKIDDNFWRTLHRILPRADKLAARFEGQPAVEAKIRQTLILCHYLLDGHKLGNPEVLKRNVERAHQILQKMHGDEHQETLEALIMVAGIHAKQNRDDQAETLFHKALDVLLRTNLDEDWHADMMNAIDGLAHLHHKQGKDHLLPALFGRLVERSRRIHEGKPDELARALDDMANQYVNWANFDVDDSAFLHAVATEHLLRASSAVETTKPLEPWRLARRQALLGSALLTQKKYADAEPSLRAGYEGLQVLPPHAAIELKQLRAESLTNLIRLHEATGNPAKAAEWRKKLPPP